MTKLEVIVNTCAGCTSTVKFHSNKDRQYITVYIPNSDYEKSIQIEERFCGWKVELLHRRPGHGKPYLLILTNQEEDDKIRISIVPHRDFVRTDLVDCTFKSLQQFMLTGPNINTTKSQIDKTENGIKLELVSRGTLRVSSHPLQVESIMLTVVPDEGCAETSNIFISTEALLKCTMFEANIIGRGDVFVNGMLTCGTVNTEKVLSVRIARGDLHVSIDGVIGQEVSKTEKNVNQTKTLFIDIARGNLTNFGSLLAQDLINLNAKNLMLCSNSKHDTAHRGFDSFVSLKKDQGFIPDITSTPKASSSFNDDRILRAVTNIDCETFISVVKEEIDPAVLVHGENAQDKLCRQKHNVIDPNRKEIIRGGLNMCQWKHGIIRAAVIQCIFSEDVQDCSQLQGSSVNFNVAGSVKIFKPWTWISNSIGGQIQGDLIFDDNAMLGKFAQLQVLGNVTISRTSIVWIQEGGRLYCGETLSNGNQIVCEGNLMLDLGVLEQDREAVIISKGDLLIALREEQEYAWFGNVLVHQHFFIKIEKRVACNADLVARECDVEFLGRDAQLVIRRTLVVEDGDLNLTANDVSVDPNIVLVGQLYARGIEGTTASFTTMPGAFSNLICPQICEKNTVNVRTRCMEISTDSIMVCGERSGDNESEVVITTEEISVHGKLQSLATSLTIQVKSLTNTGEITSSSSKETTTKSFLSIECEKMASNSGCINCDENISIKSETLSNENGIIRASPNLHIKVFSSEETVISGKLYVDSCLHVQSVSRKKFSFSAVGGKAETSEMFSLPDMFIVSCTEGLLIYFLIDFRKA